MLNNMSLLSVKDDDADRISVDNDLDFEMGKLNTSFDENEEEADAIDFSTGGESSSRTINLFGGVSLVVGLMIGSGIFASPGSILSEVESIGVSLVVWMMGGLLAMAGALCYVELGTSIPKGGGEYAYLELAYGPLASFLFTFTAALIARPASNSIIAIVCSEYISKAIWAADDGSDVPSVLIVKGIAIAILLAVCILQCVDGNLAMSVMKSTTVAKLLAIAIISLSGLWVLVTSSERRNVVFSTKDWSDADISPTALSNAVVASLWAYDGWNNLNYALEEFQNPTRNLPLAILIAIPLVITCYLLVNVAYLAVLNVAEIMGSETVGVSYGTKLVGHSWGGTLVCLFVAVSAFGALNGSMIGGSRLTHVAARDGMAPRFLYGLHPTRHTPYKAIIAQSMLSCLYILPGDFEQLLAFFSFGMWIFYALTVMSVSVLRRNRPNMVRPFRVWTPLVWIFTLVAWFLVINLLVSRTKACVACLVFLAVGAGVYGFKSYGNTPSAGGDRSPFIRSYTKVHQQPDGDDEVETELELEASQIHEA
ncbi:hypothetical protein SARC_10203 [Sphaeroforma arctica JP610]|uniref:Cationic amino acid transporter C-terminal domain-containing protein n=1 Tax=Sphaeroforma arctica JP610 TaxID=667725 RepID=A0A0L0FLH3_9EUKA|nr:hypothetical protein SARC_10203 [Sphaeroforma arctica JP610]KNC77336.1 hypothetical protein SARC_10203 [Sphaeroforma arctica JP610]|eukprot:XP_014151238.1 hypothetical protein SARC_10203 [Sphaeroforma arctica JP610]